MGKEKWGAWPWVRAEPSRVLAGSLSWAKLKALSIWVLEFSLVEGGASGGPSLSVESPQQASVGSRCSCVLKTLGGLVALGLWGDPEVRVGAGSHADLRLPNGHPWSTPSGQRGCWALGT